MGFVEVGVGEVGDFVVGDCEVVVLGVDGELVKCFEVGVGEV